MQRIFATFLVIAALIAAVSFSVFIFFGVVLLGAGAYAFLFVRRYLIEKGILNPTLGVPPVEEETRAPIIEGDFTRIPEEKK